MNKASAGDGIPVELFQILKDDAVKVLHSICQQIRKTQQWPQNWKRAVFISIPKEGNAKECSNYCTIALISHTSKVMLKIIQARLPQYENWDLPDVQVSFRKGWGTRDQIANILWIIENAREFHKNIYFCFIDYVKAFDCADHNSLKKNLMIYFIIFNPTWSLYLCKLWRKGWNKIVYSVNYHITTYWKFQSFLLYLRCLLHHLSSFHVGMHLLPGLLFCCIVHCSGAIKLKTDRKLIFLYFWANTTACLFSWGL